MTGVEHYTAAEALLAGAKDNDGWPSADPACANTIATAQVHATLALADAQRRAAEALRKGTR
jgi:hypothetical protein